MAFSHHTREATWVSCMLEIAEGQCGMLLWAAGTYCTLVRDITYDAD
jgi:hypothetical protein